MNISGWQYYKHAVIPTCKPNEIPDISPIKDKSIWKNQDGFPFFARWTTDFDCGHETNWWYVIKDTPFEIEKIKAKRRYEINKGRKNFFVKEINPFEHVQELFLVQKEAYAVYPKKYRPVVDEKKFKSRMQEWNNYVVLGAFFQETNELVGYSLVCENESGCIDFIAQKVKPEYEKFAINAALVYGIFEKYNFYFSKSKFICDGARNINHETFFQDYLEKYFEFRKAYCKLHISYNPKIEWVVKAIYPFRKCLCAFDKIKIIHFINSVLRMDKYSCNELS